MSLTNDEFEEMCAAYVIGSLNTDERAQFESHLKEATPEQKEIFEKMQWTALHLPAHGQVVNPPHSLKEQITSEINQVTDSLEQGNKKSRFKILQNFSLPPSPGIEKVYTKLHLNQPLVGLLVPIILLFVALNFYLEVGQKEDLLREQQVKYSGNEKKLSEQSQELATTQQKVTELEQRLNEQSQQIAEKDKLSATIADLQKTIDAKAEIEKNHGELVGLLQSSDLRVIDFKPAKVYPLGKGKVFVNLKTKTAFMQIGNLPLNTSEKDYQAWMLEGKHATSAGVFSVDSNKTAFIKIESGITVNKLTGLSVTLEPKGGSTKPAGALFLTANVK